MIVLRSTYDAAVADTRSLAGQVARLEEEVTWLRAQLADKDRTMLALRREGFDPPPAPIAYAGPDEIQVPSVVVEAVAGVAAPGSREYWAEMKEAQRLLDSGEHEPGEVARIVLRGGDFNPFKQV